MKVHLIEASLQSFLMESMQANDMKFAFANPTDDPTKFQLVHSWVKCREYFNEFLMQNHHPNEFKWQKVYGFDYEYDKHPLDMNATRLGIKFPTSELAQEFKKNLHVLHKIEEINQVDKTELFETENPLVVFIVGSKFWIQRCLLLNLYTLTIKLLSLGMGSKPFKELLKIIIKGYVPTEIAYINNISPKTYNSLMENAQEIASVPVKYVDGTNAMRCASVVHAHSGVIAVKQALENGSNTLKLLTQYCGKFFTDPKPKNNFFKVSA